MNPSAAEERQQPAPHAIRFPNRRDANAQRGDTISPPLKRRLAQTSRTIDHVDDNEIHPQTLCKTC